MSVEKKWFYEKYAQNKAAVDYFEKLYLDLKDGETRYSHYEDTGDTRYHFLAHLGDHEELFKAIDEKKCDPNVKNEHGVSIFHLLARSGNVEGLYQAMDQKRFDPSITNKHGHTIWHYVAKSGNVEGLFKAIDDGRCDPNIKDKDGNTIWHCLEENGDYEILLKAYKRYKFDSNHISKKYRYIIETTKIELLVEYFSTTLDTIEVPEDFKCAISKKIMFDPVITEYGQRYDRRFITPLLDKSDIDPGTTQKLSTKILYPDLYTRRSIEKFLENL